MDAAAAPSGDLRTRRGAIGTVPYRASDSLLELVVLEWGALRDPDQRAAAGDHEVDSGRAGCNSRHRPRPGPASSICPPEATTAGPCERPPGHARCSAG